LFVLNTITFIIAIASSFLLGLNLLVFVSLRRNQRILQDKINSIDAVGEEAVRIYQDAESLYLHTLTGIPHKGKTDHSLSN